jgi:hypothetical protein
MKPINALILSLLAGITTFAAQDYFFPPQLHAAAMVVPTSADWRQQMIAQDPGGALVDHAIDHLTGKLDLSAEQVKQFRPLLEQQHERVLALLLTAPPSLTRDQFVAKRHEIKEQTHRQLDALLTPDQLELAKELPRHANS